MCTATGCAWLDDVATAPCLLVDAKSTAQARLDLMARIESSLHTPVRMASAKLLALLWVGNDPLAVPDRQWDREIQQAFTQLRHNTTRIDAAALEEAADAFAV
ncbi:hypothetical protein GA0115240_12621 [Streptomyces sp. DvalAA-14]|nr:hypothetical protein [Streptomyces sp. SID4948]SCD85133.1 hypothetical protein GA0115240_12621 [Streptomyces sp. DvalAA-14]